MAGHSRWANIKHRKARQDADRSAQSTKTIREITVAARLYGAMIETNPRLRTAIYKAQQANIAKDMIQRAISRGTEPLDTTHLEEICYEGYGPGGMALMVMCFSDNRNRTAAAVRHAFAKGGGKLATTGAVSYLFKKCGQIIAASMTAETTESIIEIALQAGAEDIVIHPEDETQIEILTPPEIVMEVKQSLTDIGITAEKVDIIWSPHERINIEESVTIEKITKLIEGLEALEDVQAIYMNANIPF